MAYRSKESRRAWRKKNGYSENHTPAAIACRKRYKKSAKGLANEKKYNRSSLGKKTKAKSCKKWRSRNPIRVAHYKSARRERLKNVLKTLTFQEWKLILEQFEYKCTYCDVTGKLTQDHIIPISKGGCHTKYNVVPACMSCNASKHDTDLEVWINK